MKTITTTLAILFISAIILIGAEVNYQSANIAAKNSEGTDLAIEQALSLYGFNLSWDEEPTMIQKIVAVFTPTKQADYSLELFYSGGQPMCRLTNNQFGDMYVCHMDSLVNTLINDNE